MTVRKTVDYCVYLNTKWKYRIERNFKGMDPCLNRVDTHYSQPIKYVCCSYTIGVALVLTSVILESRQNVMPWDRWSWSMPQEPIEYFFRRHENLPIKSPTFKCECPPNNECVVEFKINQDMADFLNIRGIIKKEDLKVFRADLQKLVHSDGVYENDVKKSAALRRKRRSGDPETHCCCPPKSVYMPTFITENKFNDLTGKFLNKYETSDNLT